MPSSTQPSQSAPLSQSQLGSASSFTSEPTQSDGIEEVVVEQQNAWIDATTSEGLEDVRDIPSVSLQHIDQAMMCDIQRIVCKLVGKAPQLLGIYTYKDNTFIVLTYHAQVTSLLT